MKNRWHANGARDVGGVVVNLRQLDQVLNDKVAYLDNDLVFSGGVTITPGALIVGTDPGGTSLLRVGGSIRIVGGSSVGANLGAGATEANITFDGTPRIRFNTAGTDRWRIGNTILEPLSNNAYDLGSSSLQVRTGYFGVSLVVPALYSPAAAALNLGDAGNNRWQITTSGHLIALSDNALDIGSPGAFRPRTGYFGSQLVVGPDGGQGGIVKIGHATAVSLVMTAGGRSDWTFYDSAAAADAKRWDFSMDGFGGANSFVFLLRADAGTAGNEIFRATRSGTSLSTLALIQNAGALTVGTDPGGTGLLRVGGAVRVNGSLLFSPAAATIVPGATSLSLRNNADSADNLLLTDAGAASFRNVVTITPVAGGKGLVVAGQTQTTDQPVLDLAQTWNGGAVAFTGMRLNVTDTASAGTSLLLDLQIGAASVFKVTRGGGAVLASVTASGTVGAALLSVTPTTNRAMQITSAADWGSNYGALATAATSGFCMIPSCAGAPTGAPTNYAAGHLPMVYDTTNNKLWVYNGAWKGVVLA